MKHKTIVLILHLVIFLFLYTTALAQETELQTPEFMQIEATTSSTYILPYPGMLPDNPLYKLKTLRDKLMLFLIRDQQLLAEKHIELADKELFAALKIAEKGDITLAIHTAFKGEHHMTEAIDAFRMLYAQDKTPNEKTIEQYHQASDAHQELLAGILGRATNDDERGQIITIIEFSERNNVQADKEKK